MNALVITSYTATSALGRGRDAHRSAMETGSSGLRQQAFESSTLHCWLGETDQLYQPLPAALSIWECRNNRLAWLALQQDDFPGSVRRLRERYGDARVGLFIGTSTAGIHSAELAYRARSPDSLLPDWFDYRHTHNIHSATAFVAETLQLRGITQTISTACSSSAKVFAAASRAIQVGYCDAAIVGGVDSLCLTTLYGFNSLQLLSTDVCRPADTNRAGISIGEAAGFAILERPGPGPGAPLLLGYGESCDAHHMSSPHPQGAGALVAMREALLRAGLRDDDIDYINLHGTGTRANDASEGHAVVDLFGQQTPCSSTKGWTGHTLGAAGITDAVISLLCIENGLIPGSLQTLAVDPQIRAQVLLKTRRTPVRTVLSNSFGFGGSNCSLVFGAAS